MEKEVSRWLSHTFGYQTAADAQLSAACRGNLRALWEFLMSNYKSSGQKHSIVNVLGKHRRDQAAAQRAPELRQMAQQHRKLLMALQRKAEMLDRTLASFQATTENVIVDSIEQNGERGLLQQDLHEPLAQVSLLREYAKDLQQFLPLLRTRMDNLQTVTELARTRYHKTASQKRLHHLLQPLQQVNNRIRAELLSTLEGKQPDMGSANDLEQLQQPDQQHASLEYRSTGIAGLVRDSSSSTWDVVPAEELPEPHCAGSWQNAGRSSLVSNYTPSEAVNYSVMQLLQEPPESLLTCSSQLAAQASRQLTAVLDEAERALLAPLGCEASQIQGGRLMGEGHKGVADAAADSNDSYSLPWTTSAGAAAMSTETSPAQQQRTDYITPEMLVKERQKAHVDMYLQTIKAQAAVQAADKELTLLLGSTPLLQQHLRMGSNNWEAQLAGLWLRAERLRGEVELLEQRKQDFERDVDEALKAELRLQETWELIQATVREDQELNNLLWQVSSDNLQLYTSLFKQQDEVLQQLKQQLVPCSSAAAHHSQTAKDEVQREVALLDQLQCTAIGLLQTIGAQRAAAGRTGSLAAECQAPTLIRLESAAQRLSHMGQPTTGAKTFGAGTGIGRHGGPAAAAMSMSLEGLHGFSKDCVVDSAAVSALREAAAVHEVAPVLCPAALLTEVAGEYHRLRQLQQQLEQLSAVCSIAMDHGTDAEQQTALLRTQVTNLRSEDREAVLPWLDELLVQNQNALQYVRNQMAKEVKHWKEQPAHCLLEDYKYDGKNCEQWLTKIQCLHVKRRQLSGQQV